MINLSAYRVSFGHFSAHSKYAFVRVVFGFFVSFVGGQKTFTKRMNWTKFADSVKSGKRGFQLKIDTCILNTKPLSCSYKRFSDCPIHSNVVRECCWIANSVIKILMNGFCTVMFVYFLHWHSVWRQWLEGNRKWKYIFPFEWWLMHKNAQNCYWMLIKIKKSLWNLIYAQMIVFCRWNIMSRNCSSFHANEWFLVGPRSARARYKNTQLF